MDMQVLQSIAVFFKDFNFFQRILGWAGQGNNINSWHKEGGFSYIPIPTKLVVELAEGFGDHLLRAIGASDVAFELIRLNGEIKPHYHNVSSSVVVAKIGFVQQQSLVVSRGEELVWQNTKEDEVLEIPVGAVHGFKSNGVSHLIVISRPAVADDDVVYVEDQKVVA